MIFDIAECESKLGYTFKNKMLLRQCFTHASYAHEHGESDNELLEFFGDSIMQLVVTEYLYKNVYGDEGKLTEIRKDIVSKNPLLVAVKKLGIIEFMLLGKGQVLSNEKDEKLYSSLFEAVVAGIYIDGGIVQARNFIKKNLIDVVYNKENKKKVKEINYKSQLQEYVQGKKMGSVYYETLSKTGPDHMPEFRVVVTLNTQTLAEGKGKSIKQAENMAAKSALIKLKTSRRKPNEF
ncbi:MAG: ribonuclease III [Clostridia bacterium]|nr:ribonuclease III [Clostridia bacterium]